MNELIMKLLRPLWARCVLQLWRWNLGGYKVRFINTNPNYDVGTWEIPEETKDKLNFMFENRWKATFEANAIRGGCVIVLNNRDDYVALKLASLPGDGFIFKH